MSGAPGAMLGFDYALLRAVPRADRGERVNVGVLLYCQGADFLDAGVSVDAARLRALDPGIDLDLVCASLRAVRAVCAGRPEAGAAGEGTRRDRFGRLTAPRSTVVRPGSVHGGLTTDPAAELERLMDLLVR